MKFDKKLQQQQHLDVNISLVTLTAKSQGYQRSVAGYMALAIAIGSEVGDKVCTR